MSSPSARTRRLGLSGRLVLFVVVLVFSVLGVTNLYLILRQVADLQEASEGKKDLSDEIFLRRQAELELTRRKIVERHGGTIVARGAPDEGATFLITIPAAQESPTTP